MTQEEEIALYQQLVTVLNQAAPVDPPRPMPEYPLTITQLAQYLQELAQVNVRNIERLEQAGAKLTAYLESLSQTLQRWEVLQERLENELAVHFIWVLQVWRLVDRNAVTSEAVQDALLYAPSADELEAVKQMRRRTRHRPHA